MDSSESSSRRKHPRHLLRNAVSVIDQTSGVSVGVVVNLSEEGIMLVNASPLQPDCIYQLRLDVTEGVLSESAGCEICMGVDCLWTSHAEGMASMYWSGCQIIDIADEDFARMLALIKAVGE